MVELLELYEEAENNYRKLLEVSVLGIGLLTVKGKVRMRAYKVISNCLLCANTKEEAISNLMKVVAMGRHGRLELEPEVLYLIERYLKYNFYN